MSRAFLLLTLLLLISFGSPFSARAGLNEGEVRTGFLMEGPETTLLATDEMDLSVVQPGTGSALINGDMEDFTLSTSASISSSLNQIAAASSSAVDFYDTITLNVPNFPAGTPVTVRIAWAVGGNASSSGSSDILISARSLVRGPGGQIWTRESNNFDDPETYDPVGRAEFDFVVKVGTPVEGNIKLTAAAEAVAYIDSGGIPPGSYSAGPGSNLSVSFMEVVSVETQGGTPLPVWTIESPSLLDYGVGTGPILPSNPAFQIGDSPNDPHFIEVSWHSSPIEFYTVESSIDLMTWLPETRINGDDTTIALDLLRPSKHRFYRLVTQIGTAPVSSTLLNSTPIILPSPLGPDYQRIAWMTSIDESYILQTSADPGTGWSSGPPNAGTGGAVYIDSLKPGPRNFYRVLSEFSALVLP